MLYRLPEMNDKSILQEYMQEHYDNNEAGISASLGLPASEYADWVEKIQRNALVGDEQWGKSLLYLCFDEGRLIGLLSVRYELPEKLTEIIGDIGDGVRPSERNKGYATTMLHYALSVCKEKGIIFGRPKIKLPKNFLSIAKQFSNKEINLETALSKTINALHKKVTGLLV